MGTITVKIQPNSSKEKIVKNGEEIKIYLTSPPIEGKANKELIKLLSKKLKTPKSSIRIIKGEKSRVKTIEIEDMERKEIEKKLFT